MLRQVKEIINDIDQLKGKRVHFVSDCEFFPNFNIRCKVLDISKRPNERVMNVRVIPSNKIIQVGSNMKNLRFEYI